jgi:hypothetical protein
VKASIPAAIWATPPAPLPHRVRRHPRLQHHQPKFASSVTRLGESAAIGHSPREVFFGGTELFPAELPAIDCRPTADVLIWKTVKPIDSFFSHVVVNGDVFSLFDLEI